jgi:cell wall-associated NlpC family hydrolase
MLKKVLYSLLIVVFLTACGSSRQVENKRKSKRTISKRSKQSDGKASIADKVVWTAVTYKGVPYKFGGTTRKGMDCSGLIHTSFKKRNIYLPRTSYGMFSKGYEIPLRDVRRGDLLFFITAKKRRTVNHVGLVTSADRNNIQFIHSTTSRGVIVSSLNMPYWNAAFYKAKRVLEHE